MTIFGKYCFLLFLTLLRHHRFKYDVLASAAIQLKLARKAAEFAIFIVANKLHKM